MDVIGEKMVVEVDVIRGKEYVLQLKSLDLIEGG